jgi:hypothetical protein
MSRSSRRPERPTQGEHVGALAHFRPGRPVKTSARQLTADPRNLLQAVCEDLSQYDPYPETAGIDDQDAWMRREEAESASAGLINTALAPGRVDKRSLNETRALVERGGTRADQHR